MRPILVFRYRWKVLVVQLEVLKTRFFTHKKGDFDGFSIDKIQMVFLLPSPNMWFKT